jgi:YlmC/YmxH family sporulation protein
MITFQELKRKDVLEISSGKNLGKITDLVIEKRSGKIQKIIVPGKRGGFLSCENLEIKYSKIQKIGDDVILVDLSSDCVPPKPCKPEPPCAQTDKCCDIEFDGFQDE